MGIRQLASELRLSIGTVSRALNDRPDVNPETRARVKEAALRAGYVPNQSGRSLRSGRTGIVAAVIPTRGFAPQLRRRPLHRARGRAAHAAAAGARPDRAVPRPGRGPAREPAAHRAAAHRRRGHHQPDHRPRPAPRLPARPPASTTSPSAAAPGSRTIPSSTSTSRRWPREAVRALRRATGTAGWRWRSSERAAELRDAASLEAFRAEAVAARARRAARCGVLPTGDGRLTAGGLRRASPTPPTAPTAVLATHEMHRRRALRRPRASSASGRPRRLGDLHLPGARHPRAGAGALALRRRPRRRRDRAGRAADRAAARRAERPRAGRVAGWCRCASSPRASHGRAAAPGQRRDPGAVARRRPHAGLDEGDAGDAVLDRRIDHVRRHRLARRAAPGSPAPPRRRCWRSPRDSPPDGPPGVRLTRAASGPAPAPPRVSSRFGSPSGVYQR